MPPTVPPTFAEKDLDYYLRMIRGDFSELEETHAVRVGAGSSQKNIVALLGAPWLGHEPVLGIKLLQAFLRALIQGRVKPRALILVNEAVRLAAEGSAALEELKVLEEQGIRILVCVISVDDLGLEEQLKVGAVADMDNICDHLLNAWKVIRL